MRKSNTYIIHDFTIDHSTNTILHENRSIKLEPGTMELLILLVEKNGQVATRGELIEKVWGGSSMAEDYLSKTISTLRKLFRELSPDYSLIETVHKVGYRFTGRTGSAENKRTRSSTIRLLGKSVLLLLLTLGAIVFAVTIYFWGR